MDIASNYINDTVRQGRSLGLHIVYATQSFDDLEHNIVENTGVLIVFGSESTEYAKNAQKLGFDSSELMFLPVGVAFIRRRSKGTIPVRVFNFESYLK
jgi:DNA helicase HerA-like ATPase